MERLTEKHYNGKGYYLVCSGVLRCDNKCDECEELFKAIDCLGEYEDKAEQKPKTNADRIRAMSDEELRKLLIEFSAFSCIFPDKDCEDESCVDCVTKYLQQPAEEE